MLRAVTIGTALFATILFEGCFGCGHDQPLPDRNTKDTPSKQDLLEFHRLRALALDSLIDQETAKWGSVLRSGTGIRSERLDSIPGSPAVSALAEGTVRALHHRLSLLDGTDLTPAPLVKRKEALQALLAESGEQLRYSEHFTDEGGLVLKHACRLSLEGIISKVADAPYRSGRGRDWVK